MNFPANFDYKLSPNPVETENLREALLSALVRINRKKWPQRPKDTK
jgi:hypothetical protein